VDDINDNEEAQVRELEQRTARQIRTETREVKPNFAELDIFAETGTTKLYFDGTDNYILVRDELDFGEQSILDNAAIRGVQRNELQDMATGGETGQTVLINLSRQRFLLLSLYIVGWNLHDRRGVPVKLPRTVDERERLFKRMRPAWGDAMVDMVTKHIQERAEKMAAAEQIVERDMGIMSAPEDEERDPLTNGSGQSVVLTP
jgi:hypothetical protein